MIARGFRSVGWVAAVGGAALGCYMLSLQVATERAELASVERRIVAAKQEIRSLQTELGTRGRLSQLERWNADVLALSAPGSGQFLQSEVTLARFDQREKTIEETTAVRLASLETTKPADQPVIRQAIAVAEQPLVPPSAVIHRASFQSAPLQSRLEAKPQAPLPQTEAKSGQKGKAQPTAQAAVQVQSKPQPTRLAQAKVDKPRTALISSKLAQEIGVAARAENKQASGGTR